MRLKTLLILISLLILVPQSAFSLSHIKLGLYHIHNMETSSQVWVGNTYDIVLGSRVNQDNLNTLFATNPNVLYFNYVSGNSFYKPQQDAPGGWDNVYSWATGASKNIEDAFYHYQTDKSYTNTYHPRDTTIHIPGTAAGTIPGDAGGDSKSRIPHWQWGQPTSGRFGAVYVTGTAVKSSGTVTVATTAAHGYSVGFRLNADGASTDTEWNGDNLEILTVPDTTHFTYAQAGSDGSKSLNYRSSSKSISNIARVSNTVTVATSSNHYFYEGDYIQISNCSTASFNGNFKILTRASTSFTYSQTGSDESAANGVATHFGWNNFPTNYGTSFWSDYYISVITSSLTDTASNKVNGFYYDSILNQVLYQTGSEYSTKCKEYLDSGQPTVTAWLSGIIQTWLAAIESGVSTFLTGSGKTAYTAGNGDSFRYVGDNHDFYSHADAPDIILLEDHWLGYMIPYENIDTDIARMKVVWDLMDSHSKKVIYESRSGWARHPKKTWTNYSGYIWYTDGYASGNRMYPTALYAGSSASYSATTRVAAVGDINQAGKFAYDLTTGRLWAWFGSNYNPNTGTTEDIQNYEPYTMFRLASFYVMGNHTNGYFFPYETGTVGGGSFTYAKTIGANQDYWWDAIGYNVGSPATGGLVVGGGNGPDLWAESTATSSKAYEMWRSGTESRKRLYARKYDNGYAVVRFKYRGVGIGYVGDDPLTFTMPFTFKKLRGDGTLDSTATDQLTIAEGEGAILITNYDTPPPAVAPTVTTSAVSNITTTTASAGGNVTDDGGGTISQCGVCWNTTGSPTTSDSKTTDGCSAEGAFTSSITGLSQGTHYYYRAYTTNETDTSYGGTVEFTTLGFASITGIGSGTGPHTITIQGTGTLTITITTP